QKLRKQNQVLRAGWLTAAAQLAKYPDYAKLLGLERGKTFPKDYRAENATVISSPAGPFTHSVTIDKGSSSGIRRSDPVMSGDGLVGIVSNVFAHTALVTLMNDPEFYAEARDLNTGVRGGVKVGPGGTLGLINVSKTKVVHKGDVLVTDGTRSRLYPDLYPYGIPIGRVAAPPGATDTAIFLQVQVQPYANLGSLDAVAVL